MPSFGNTAARHSKLLAWRGRPIAALPPNSCAARSRSTASQGFAMPGPISEVPPIFLLALIDHWLAPSETVLRPQGSAYEFSWYHRSTARWRSRH
jgi:hypothetical protein